MSQTRAKWINNTLTFYDRTTHERVLPLAPVVFKDEFFGASTVIPAAGAPESGCAWVKKIVGAGPPTVAKVADGANGLIQCALTADNQKQSADLYMDDQREFDVTHGLIWEAVIRLPVLPTDVAELNFGLIDDWADGYDANVYSAFFTADGSGLITCEVDDNATNSSASSGVTVTAGQTRIYRIDFTDVTNVLFFIDGAHVATGTTFPYAATGANAILQPLIGAYKATGVGVGTIKVDKVQIWSQRS